jgi:hypothetical protein
MQVGGFASRAEAEEALRKALTRLRPGQGRGDDVTRVGVGSYELVAQSW